MTQKNGAITNENNVHKNKSPHLIKAVMTNLVLFNGLKNAIKKIYKKYKKLIIKKMRKWYKNSKIFKKIIMKIAYWGSYGDLR